MNEFGSWLQDFVTKLSFKISINVGTWVVEEEVVNVGFDWREIRSLKTPSILLCHVLHFPNN